MEYANHNEINVNNQQIIEKVNHIKKHSIAYQRIRQYIEYGEQKEDNCLCISEKFITKLFEELANGLGYEYKHK